MIDDTAAADDWQIVDDEHSDNDEWVSVSDEDDAEYVDACADLEGAAMLEDGMGSEPVVEGNSNVGSTEPMSIDSGECGGVESAPSSAASSLDDKDTVCASKAETRQPRAGQPHSLIKKPTQTRVARRVEIDSGKSRRHKRSRESCGASGFLFKNLICIAD